MRILQRRFLAIGFSCMVLGACAGERDLLMSSTAFVNDGPIPVEYTCDGTGTTPPIAVDHVPEGARSLALLVDDIDVPNHQTFVHWMAWNIPPGTREITDGATGSGSVQGKNSAGTTGYTGPCPDPGRRHRYVFTVYALDTLLTGAPLDREAFKRDLRYHVLARGTLTGTYQISSPRSKASVQQTGKGAAVNIQ